MKYPAIKKLLDERNISYRQLGEALGLSTQAVYRRMSGKTAWTLQDVVRLCSFLNVWDLDSLGFVRFEHTIHQEENQHGIIHK